MAKRIAQSPALQASLDLQATITDVTSRNRQVSAIALLQGEGSEDTVNRERVITNMKVSDADVVKAVNSIFFLERRCCRTTTGLISSQTVCRVAEGSLVKTTNKKTLHKGFATTSLVGSTTAGHEHDYKQNMKCWLGCCVTVELGIPSLRTTRGIARGRADSS